MKPQPPIYIPPPARTPIWTWVQDGIAGIGAAALVLLMIFVSVELGFILQCLIGGKCD